MAEVVGTVLAVAPIVASLVAKLAAISDDYRSAFSELKSVENGLRRLQDVLQSLCEVFPHNDNGGQFFENVPKDLGECMKEVEAFADKRLKSLGKQGMKPFFVKLKWHKDTATLQRV
jgi:hypothetical protein